MEGVMKNATALLLCSTALSLFLVMFCFQHLPDIDPTKPLGMVHYVRTGQYVNGIRMWTITQIDSTFFSRLSNHTIISLEIHGGLTDRNVGSVYVNDHLVGIATVSQGVYAWGVPVDFCDETTSIKIVSAGWDVQRVDLRFYVRLSEVSPWWKQNLLTTVLMACIEITGFALIAKKAGQWIKTE